MKQHYKKVGAVNNISGDVKVETVMQMNVINHFPDATKMVCPADRSINYLWLFVLTSMVALAATMTGGFSAF